MTRDQWCTFMNNEGKPTEVEYWYNRYEHSWVVQVKDENGCQVGSSDYLCGEGAAQLLACERARAHGGLRVVKTNPSGETIVKVVAL